MSSWTARSCMHPQKQDTRSGSDDTPENMAPLFETILKYIPAPEGDPDADTQVLISTIDYNEYVGRIGVGKVESGTIAVNQELTLLNHHDPDKETKVKISKLYEFDGLNKVEVKEATIGSIVAISGIAESISVIPSAAEITRKQFRSRRFPSRLSP